MFKPSQEDIEMVLNAYGIVYHMISVTELQRSMIKNNDNITYDIRLILRVDADNGKSYVIRLKKEKGVDLFLLENQCKFAETLKTGKIKTPYQYHINGRYANSFKIQGYGILVTVEEFVYGEITCVDEEIAHKTGRLLAKMHEIAETQQLHVNNQVLFNPFKRNELFDYFTFRQLEDYFYGADLELFQKIVVLYENYLTILEPLRLQPKYAVQGDISDCNLFMAADGEIGVYDFNRCGDNYLFCDAIMQGIFESKLMDYPEVKSENFDKVILKSFFSGYGEIRPFTSEQKKWYPYLYAIVNAFWSSDIKWDENSLFHACKRTDKLTITRHLKNIWEKLCMVLKK